MTQKRSTPLHLSNISGHHCTIDLRLGKLAMVPFFQSLSKSELREINKKFDVNHFNSGDSIYFQAEKATRLRVLVHGIIKLLRHSSEGKDILLDMLKPGEFFGTLSDLGENVYQETAMAQTDVCVMSFGATDFRMILKNYPPVAIAVLDITTNKLRSSHDKLHQLATLSVPQRIVHILGMLSEKFGEESEYGKLLQLPLSRRDIADMAGTSTETASRIMSDLQDKELIVSGRQWVAIKNPDQLKKLADG